MPATALAPALADTPADILPGLAELIARELAPKVVDIDLKGVYPGDFLKQLGALGGLGSLTPVEHGGTALGLGHAIQVIEEVSKECVSTGFLLWAEYALQWYVINSSNRELVAEQVRRLGDHVVLQVTHVGEVAELALAHGLGFQRDDRVRVGLSFCGEGRQTFGIDGFEDGVGFQGNDFRHGMTP
jgi:hypothetical protein